MTYYGEANLNTCYMLCIEVFATPQGEAGKPGVPGRDGVPGKDGIPGLPGKQVCVCV